MRELVLTGYHQFWPKENLAEKNALYLGAWCFSNNLKHTFLEQKDFDIAVSPYSSWADVKEANEYTDSFLDRILPAIAGNLNLILGTQFSNDRWKITLSYWLLHFIGIFYDRYLRIKKSIIELKENYVVKIISFDHRKYNSISEFLQAVVNTHDINLVLFSILLKEIKFEHLIIKEYDYFNLENWGISEIKKKKGKLFHALIEKINDKSKDFFYKFECKLGQIYGLNPLEKLKILFEIYGFKNVLNKFFSGDTDFSFEEKIDILDYFDLEFKTEREFETVFSKYVMYFLPSDLLRKTKVKDNQKKIWIGNEIVAGKFVNRIAAIVESGGLWIDSQHGGGYGESYSFPLGKIEYGLSSEFITWGWCHNHIYNGRFTPMPSPKLSKLKSHKKGGKFLLYVSTTYPVYVYRLQPHIFPEKQFDYYQSKIQFINGLNESIRSKLRYKAYPYDYGQNDLSIISSVMNEKQIILSGTISKFLNRSRLVVIDHLPSTSPHECMVTNVPLILILPNNIAEFTNEAKVYYEKLHKVGILYYDSKDAVKKVNEIWENVENWWQTKKVQDTRNEFCFKFARSSSDWRKQWTTFIKEKVKSI